MRGLLLLPSLEIRDEKKKKKRTATTRGGKAVRGEMRDRRWPLLSERVGLCLCVGCLSQQHVGIKEADARSSQWELGSSSTSVPKAKASFFLFINALTTTFIVFCVISSCNLLERLLLLRRAHSINQIS